MINRKEKQLPIETCKRIAAELHRDPYILRRMDPWRVAELLGEMSPHLLLDLLAEKPEPKQAPRRSSAPAKPKRTAKPVRAAAAKPIARRTAKPRTPRVAKIDPASDQVLELVADHDGPVAIGGVMAALTLPRSRAARILATLVEQKKLAQIGKGRGAKYVEGGATANGASKQLEIAGAEA